MDKFGVLASALDRLIEDQNNILRDEGIDDEIETLDIGMLAEQIRRLNDVFKSLESANVPGEENSEYPLLLLQNFRDVLRLCIGF